MSNQLTKADAARKRTVKNPDSLLAALTNGGPIVWLSCIIMGLGNIVAGQFVKGLLWLAIEVFVICALGVPYLRDVSGNNAYSGIEWLKMLPSLGDVEDTEKWNENDFVFEYVLGDRSYMILLYSVLFIGIIILFAVMWRASVRSGYKALSIRKAGKKAPTFIQDVKSLFDENIHKLLMPVPFMGIVVFTIVPLVYMMCMAFTNYSDVGNKTKLFDWVGFDTFKMLFDGDSVIGQQFWSVLGWTLVWAFFATFLNFFFGTFVAMMINRPSTKIKGFWRTVLSLTIAVPQFVSLMLINKMFTSTGVVNTMLQEAGWISKAIPFWADQNLARVMVIVINLWVGIPYTVMQVTGILKNIPADLYEAARIDGANVVQQFMNITLPYMIFVMTPYIITSFTGNINNFNVIFLLTGGGPFSLEGSAGKTDLLVTWLYRLSMERYEYNLAAVIGIFTFIVLASVSLITYRSSGSYKDEEGFK